MVKWSETHPAPPIPNYQQMIEDTQRRFPPIVRSAVLSNGPGSCRVRCMCGNEFSYMQDVVNCKQCGRFFDKGEAEDLT